MTETLCLGDALGLFEAWLKTKGNLRTRQLSPAFVADLIKGAEFLLRVHGFAKNPGKFPVARMQLAPHIGIGEARLKRCIPVWMRAGVLRRISILIRRKDAPEGMYQDNPDRGFDDVHWCPHQYLLGEAFERIFGLQDGTRIADPPPENQCGQERFSNVSGEDHHSCVRPEHEVSVDSVDRPVRFSDALPDGAPKAEPRPRVKSPVPAVRKARTQRPDDDHPDPPSWPDDPLSATEAYQRLHAVMVHVDRLPAALTRQQREAHQRACEAVGKAEAWVTVFEASRMPSKPLSEEAMRSCRRVGRLF